MDEMPLIQQYLQLRSEFMGYLYAMTREAELAEEIYQNAAVVVIEKAEQPETIRNFRASLCANIRETTLSFFKVEGTESFHDRECRQEN